MREARHIGGLENCSAVSSSAALRAVVPMNWRSGKWIRELVQQRCRLRCHRDRHLREVRYQSTTLSAGQPCPLGAPIVNAGNLVDIPWPRQQSNRGRIRRLLPNRGVSLKSCRACMETSQINVCMDRPHRLSPIAQFTVTTPGAGLAHELWNCDTYATSWPLPKT